MVVVGAPSKVTRDLIIVARAPTMVIENLAAVACERWSLSGDEISIQIRKIFILIFVIGFLLDNPIK